MKWTDKDMIDFANDVRGQQYWGGELTTERLLEIFSRDKNEPDGSDREMEEFAEWISEERYIFTEYGWYQWGDPNPTQYFTSEQLLELFRQSKPNPQP